MWVEILLVILGTVLSVGAIYITRALDKKSKIMLYGKIVYSGFNDNTWGFHNDVFHVPLWLEVHNTSNAAHIIRDVNVVLFSGGKEISSMVQCQKIGATKTHEEIVFGDAGSYSFALAPTSIIRYVCYFILEKECLNSQTDFDEIRLRYYDEKNNIHTLPFKKVEKCWIEGNLQRNEKWQLIK